MQSGYNASSPSVGKDWAGHCIFRESLDSLKETHILARVFLPYCNFLLMYSRSSFVSGVG